MLNTSEAMVTKGFVGPGFMKHCNCFNSSLYSHSPSEWHAQLTLGQKSNFLNFADKGQEKDTSHAYYLCNKTCSVMVNALGNCTH